MQSAPKSFDFKNPEDTYLNIRGEMGGQLDLSIYVSDHGLHGCLEINPDGSVRKLHPPT